MSRVSTPVQARTWPHAGASVPRAPIACAVSLGAEILYVRRP